jgi:hypothetical protein
MFLPSPQQLPLNLLTESAAATTFVLTPLLSRVLHLAQCVAFAAPPSHHHVSGVALVFKKDNP